MRHDYADRRGYADTHVGQIHYAESGRRSRGESPIILLHQTSSSSVMWARAMNLLAQNHHVVAMDTPGFGMSDPPERAPTDMTHYATAVVGLLDHLGADRAHLIGFHTGASIAVEVAAEHRERVATLTIAPILGFLTPAELADWSSRDDLSAPWTPDTDNRFLQDHVLDYVAWFSRPGDEETHLRELIAKLQAGPDYWWAYRAVLGFDAATKVKMITAPVLVLNVEDEVLHEYTIRAHRAIPNSQYVEIPGPPRNQPGWVAVIAEYGEEFSRAVLAFIDQFE